jgi:hypothetical protein
MSSWTALGTFALYVAGYLALRFHLLVMGIATDLSVLDERYVFAGAQFLVYLVSSLPSILVMAAPFAAVGWLMWRWLPVHRRARLVLSIAQPHVLVAIGIVVSVVSIQVLLRQCFLLQDLLLANRLPAEPSWLVVRLLGQKSMPVYFNGLVACCLVPLATLISVWRLEESRLAVTFWRGMLTVLVAIQCLFLPINFGVLIVNKTLARVTSAGERAPLAGDVVWLAWEGKDDVTFLVCNTDGRHRSLLAQPRAKVGAIEVVGSDKIFPTLFTPAGDRRTVPLPIPP